MKIKSGRRSQSTNKKRGTVGDAIESLNRWRSQNIYIGPRGEAPKDFVEIPKNNDRMWAVKLWNRNICQPPQTGTLTAFRMLALVIGIKKRYPHAVKHPTGQRPPSHELHKPITYRTKRAGRVVAIITALEGPIKRLQH